MSANPLTQNSANVQGTIVQKMPMRPMKSGQFDRSKLPASDLSRHTFARTLENMDREIQNQQHSVEAHNCSRDTLTKTVRVNDGNRTVVKPVIVIIAGDLELHAQSVSRLCHEASELPLREMVQRRDQLLKEGKLREASEWGRLIGQTESVIVQVSGLRKTLGVKAYQFFELLNRYGFEMARYSPQIRAELKRRAAAIHQWVEEISAIPLTQTFKEQRPRDESEGIGIPHESRERSDASLTGRFEPRLWEILESAAYSGSRTARLLLKLDLAYITKAFEKKYKEQAEMEIQWLRSLARKEYLEMLETQLREFQAFLSGKERKRSSPIRSFPARFMSQDTII